jgi:hypothetical protein
MLSSRLRPLEAKFSASPESSEDAMTRRRPSHLELVAIDGKEVRGTCHHMTGQQWPADALGLDRIERLALTVMRHLCASLASQTTHGWERAHEVAEAALGSGAGPAFTGHLTTLLRAIGSEWARPFAYMAADCPTCSRRITAEEVSVIQLIRAARMGDQQHVVWLASSLSRGLEAPRIAEAVRVLGSRLEGYALHAMLQMPVHEQGAENEGRSSEGHLVIRLHRPSGPSHAD